MVPCIIDFTHEGLPYTGWLVGTRTFPDNMQTLQFIVACPAFKAPVILEQSAIESHAVMLPPTEGEGTHLWSIRG
jgi:hypothetical protein